MPEVQETPIESSVETIEYDMTEDVEGNESASNRSASSTSAAVNIPAGIYSFENLANPGMFMSLPSNSAIMGVCMTAKSFTTPPIEQDTSATAGLFRVTPYGNTGRYVIRLLQNENLTMTFMDHEFATVELYPDTIAEQTFYITYDSGGYLIQPYGYSDYVRSPVPEEAYDEYHANCLVMGSASDGADARWVLRGRSISLEGVFALESVANPSHWMNLSFPDSGGQVAHASYNESPAATFTREGLWKISRYRDTDYYILRPMLNNYVSFDLYYSDVLTKYVNMIDERMSLIDTYSIYFNNGTFIFQPYGRTDALCVRSNFSSDQNLTVAAGTGTRAQWRLQQYVREEHWGATISFFGSFIAGHQVTFTINRAYATYQAVCYTTPSLINGSNSLVSMSYTNGPLVTDSRMGTLTCHDDGNIDLSILFERMSSYIPDDLTVSIVIEHDVELVLPEGKYFFQNRELGNYMQIDNDDASNGHLSQAAILELWDFNGGEHQKWDVLHVRDGYYRIVSLCGDKVISVPTDGFDSASTLWQAFYGEFDYQHWKITQTATGSYVLRPKSAESYATDWCMGAGDGVLITNGRNVKQRAYTNDSDFKDEWILFSAEALSQVEGQQQSNWCWAASARMASMKYPHVTISQASAAVFIKLGIETANPDATQIAQSNFGGVVEETEHALEYITGIENVYSKWGKIYDESTLKNLLDQNLPVIILMGFYNNDGHRTSGHYVIIYNYHWDATDNLYVYDIFNPSPIGLGSSYSRSYQNICNGKNIAFHEDVYGLGIWEGIVVYEFGDYKNTINWSSP